jgi:hypothetical protein
LHHTSIISNWTTPDPSPHSQFLILVPAAQNITTFLFCDKIADAMALTTLSTIVFLRRGELACDFFPWSPLLFPIFFLQTAENFSSFLFL